MPGVASDDGPIEPLPPVPLRRLPRLVGAVFYLWVLAAACVATVAGALAAFAVMPFERDGRLTALVTRTWARAILAAAGADVRVHFEAPLPDGPVILAANHQGLFDILALFARLDRRFVFVAKKQLFRIPFLGWHMKAAGYIRVDRGDRAQAIRSLEKAGEIIRGGRSVAVFPEGTRSADGHVLPFKKGPFMMALQARVPIVPLAINGSLHVNPKRRWYVCPNTIQVLVGPALPTADCTEAQRDDLMRRVRTRIIRMHRRLGGLGGDIDDAIARPGLEGLGRADREGEAP